mgnify:CR=1 FL=1
MKLSRKILSLVLALVMVMGLAATAFAVGNEETTTETGRITITNALGGETYNAYQILYLESYNAGKKIYAYKANPAWEEWLKTQTAYVSFNDQGYVTWVEGANPADFAKAAKGQLSSKTADGSVKATADGSATISNLKLGYYLVDSTVGALCELNTTKPSMEITDKNPRPTIEKKVQEDSNDSWGDVNDADIGQIVNFKSTVSAKPGARKYVVHDKMDAALEFGGVTSIMAGSATLTEHDYTVVRTDLPDDCTFHIVFTDTYLDSITADTNIVINYTAKLTSDAVAGTGYDNETWLDYGDNQHTEHDTTTTYTWKLPIYKYHMDGDTKKALPGAEFILYKGSEENRVYAQVTEGKLIGWTTTKTDATTLVSGADGMIAVEGLDADTYYLEETKAPGGYNKLAGPVKVEISHAVTDAGAHMTHTLKQDATNVEEVGIENKSGTELPSTGGIGTTIFYVLGSILVIGAVVLLITKKRMSAAA